MNKNSVINSVLRIDDAVMGDGLAKGEADGRTGRDQRPIGRHIQTAAPTVRAGNLGAVEVNHRCVDVRRPQFSPRWNI